jgi:hypothetical protein
MWEMHFFHNNMSSENNGEMTVLGINPAGSEITIRQSAVPD